ncbi:hypothetical protein GGI07_001372 [Coemansia sp. Benny D115]|nr:hypothetical protein GGI07_001372 [Coemansia sp. Benny D115]
MATSFLTGLLLALVCLFTGGAAGRRIAVIGAGASGAAAAYFAQVDLAALGEERAEIHVFERSDRVGGRARAGSVEFNNQTLHFEQGASMFIGKNRHLMELAKELNLTLCAHPCTFAGDVGGEGGDGGGDSSSSGALGKLGGYGLWDPNSGDAGGRWVVRQRPGRWVRGALQMLWRYGGTGDLSTVRKRTAQAVDEFLTSYVEFAKDPRGGAYSTWDEYVAAKPLMQQSLYYRAAEFYSSRSSAIGRRFLDEVVSLATRVNYMQDVDTINTMGAHISMAAESDKAYSVAGGNWQIFAGMLQRSGASVHLGAAVQAVARENGPGSKGYRVSYKVGDLQEQSMVFDTVIVAAPLPLSDIRLHIGDTNSTSTDAGVRARAETAVDYVRMHVTFAIGVLRRDLFADWGADNSNSSGSSTLPRLIITPYRTSEPFNCMSILACLDSGSSGSGSESGAGAGAASALCGRAGGTVLVKIFSHAPIELDRVFERVDWKQAHTWHAYPRLEPRNAAAYSAAPAKGSKAFSLDRAKLPPIVLDRRDGADARGGVYYIGGMEALFSTMESQTVAARHVVRLALFGPSAAQAS